MRTQINTLIVSSILLAFHSPPTQAAAPAAAQGYIQAKGYLNIGGTAVTDLTGNAKFPNSPDVVTYPAWFEWNPAEDIDTPANNAYGENYGAQLVGYFYPPTTGDYVFFLAADDNANLYLSTGEEATDKKLIANEAGWSNPRNWDTIGGTSTVEAKNSSTFASTEWPTKDTAAGGAKITLTAKRPYYIEAIFKEGGGGDNLAVAVQAPDGSINAALPIPGAYLSPLATPAAATIVAQPVSAAVYAGSVARFSVGLDIPPGGTITNIRWQKNGVDIPDSNTNALSLVAVIADNGAKFKAIITTSTGTLTSSEATLNVATLTNEFAAGVVKFEAYTDIGGGTAVSDLTGNDKFTAGTPDDVRLLTAVDSPNGYGDNYGAKVSGFIIAPETASYRFFIRSDDASQFYLSTDTNEANAVLIAEETGCCDAFHDPDDSLVPNYETSAAQSLQAGRRYAFYALLKEGGGGDYVQVAARKEGDTTAPASLQPLSGSWIGANSKPTLGTPSISQQPQSLPQLIEGTSGRLTVDGTITPTGYNFPLVIQWQKNGTNIPGATAKSLVIGSATPANSGTYRVILSSPNGETVTSAEATVTVVPDTFPPKLIGLGSLVRSNLVEIGVGYDEDVDGTTAGSAANYTLSKGTLTGVRYQRFAHSGDAGKFVLGPTGPFAGYAAVLTTSGLVPGDSVTVTVKNVKDLKNNAIGAAGESKTLSISPKMKWAAMGGTDYIEGAPNNPEGLNSDAALWPDDAVAYSEKDFDLISGGSANWDAYDEATFVYEDVTGDFDKVVRVEYHDPSSQWARAGMCATPSADEGVSRTRVADGGYTMAQRYMLRANPAVQWNGTAGNNQNEADWRDTPGGTYGGTGAGNPAYPNAWLRMQRKGQNFTGFYSADGKTWTAYGAHSFGTTDESVMPDKLLVGIYYSPEFGNNGAALGIQHSTVAKFRDYGNFVADGGAGEGSISVSLASDGQVRLTYQNGRLQMATQLAPSANWTDVAGAASPYQVNPSNAPVQFYRVVSP